MNIGKRLSAGRIGIRLMALIPILSLSILLNGCGGRTGYFKIEGHLLQMNQAEFYLYSTDGTIGGIDTIKLNGGRFIHEIPCKDAGTVILVFPNYSELPIFAESGKGVSLEGNASHLKELEVKGTKTNELMSLFRKKTIDASLENCQKEAADMILENPESPLSIYLFHRYFIISGKTDFAQGRKLLDAIKSKQGSNNDVNRLEQDFGKLKASAKGLRLPTFKGTDINGNQISEADIKGELAVIYAWATWNYESQDQQRELRRLAKRYGGRLKILGINLDASKQRCQGTLKRDSITTPTVCDEKIFETPLYNQLGLTQIPDNIIIGEDGKILDHGLRTRVLREKIEKLMKLPHPSP